MKFFEQLEGLVFGKMDVIKTLFSIMTLEARLAGLSIYPLLLNICLLLMVLMTVWLVGMFLLGYVCNQMFKNPIFAMSFVLLLNLSALLGLLSYLTFNLKKMSFEKTREYILTRENHDDRFEKEINSQNCRDGEQITVSTS